MAATASATSYQVAGPLTTPFVPPTYCTSAIGLELGVTCDSNGGLSRASGCFPSGISFPNVQYLSQVYSPAIACPVGWTSRTRFESTVTCCPSNFAASGTSCISTKTLLPGYNNIYSCSGSLPLSSYITPWSASSSISTATIYAIQVRVVIDPTDTFTVFTGSLISSSVSSSARLGSSSSNTISTGGPLTQDPGPEPKKLSGGAIAGIAIGVLAFFALLIGAVVFFLRRRKQRANHAMSGPHSGGDLPEFVATGPQPYANSSARHSQTKMPPVITEKTNTPSLRTAVSPVPTTPTQTDTNELFLPTHTTNRRSDVSELATPAHMHQNGNRDTFATTASSATYPRSPLSELTSFESPHQSTINHNMSPVYTSNSRGQEPEYQPTDRDSQVARLEAEKAMLDKLKARQLAQIEQEQANLQAELERLRGAR